MKKLKFEISALLFLTILSVPVSCWLLQKGNGYGMFSFGTGMIGIYVDGVNIGYTYAQFFWKLVDIIVKHLWFMVFTIGSMGFTIGSYIYGIYQEGIGYLKERAVTETKEIPKLWMFLLILYAAGWILRNTSIMWIIHLVVPGIFVVLMPITIWNFGLYYVLKMFPDTVKA